MLILFEKNMCVFEDKISYLQKAKTFSAELNTLVMKIFVQKVKWSNYCWKTVVQASFDHRTKTATDVWSEIYDRQKCKSTQTIYDQMRILNLSLSSRYRTWNNVLEKAQNSHLILILHQVLGINSNYYQFTDPRCRYLSRIYLINFLFTISISIFLYLSRQIDSMFARKIYNHANVI